MTPAVGDTVLFRMGPLQVEKVNSARAKWVGSGIHPSTFFQGAMAHVGRDVVVGEWLPMVVTGADNHACEGQVFLPGNDSMWIAGVTRGEDAGQWRPR